MTTPTTAPSLALLPCPFCGGRGSVGGMCPWIACEECGATGASENTEAEAIAAWNTRAALQADPVAFVPRQEMLDALAEQRRRLGRENDGEANGFRLATANMAYVFRAAKNVCSYDWSDNDDDAVAAIDDMRSALEIALSNTAPPAAAQVMDAMLERACAAFGEEHGGFRVCRIKMRAALDAALSLQDRTP